MENLKILSMNLGYGFIPIKDRKKKRILKEQIRKENYDIIMLQGNSIDVNYEDLGYEAVNDSGKVVTFFKEENLPICATKFSGRGTVNTLVTSYYSRPLAVINVNCKDKDNSYDVRSFDTVLDMCKKYSNPDSEYFVRRMIVAGRFPKGVDTNAFCDMFDLDDVSTLVGIETHIKNNKEMLNHLFISRYLECNDIHKLVGLSEVSRVGEAYPIEASISYKKVLK